MIFTSLYFENKKDLIYFTALQFLHLFFDPWKEWKKLFEHLISYLLMAIHVSWTLKNLQITLLILKGFNHVSISY